LVGENFSDLLIRDSGILELKACGYLLWHKVTFKLSKGNWCRNWIVVLNFGTIPNLKGLFIPTIEKANINFKKSVTIS
jgi:hypothetical protein